MPIAELLEQIRSHPDCEVIPPTGKILSVDNNLLMPSDLQEFYSLCDGVRLFVTAEYKYRILGIDEVVKMDRAYYGECWCDDAIISSSWYFVAENWNGDKIAIDTNEARLGRCYDCFIGEGYPVIAQSFEELLTHLFDNRGEYTYWLKNDFIVLDPCS